MVSYAFAAWYRTDSNENTARQGVWPCRAALLRGERSPYPFSPSFFYASSRILYLRIFPAAFMGKASMNSMYRGTLCLAMWERT